MSGYRIIGTFLRIDIIQMSIYFAMTHRLALKRNEFFDVNFES